MSVTNIRALCVYCGSSSGTQTAYLDLARSLGRALGERGITLVYGGARVGLMGAVADAALSSGAQAIGVIPKRIRDAEVAHEGLSELHVVSSMHERKALMAERSDAFIVLPGGIGTLEEMFETWTWSQLGFHSKPIGVLNTRGYFDHLFAFLEHSVNEGFLGRKQRQLILTSDQPDDLIEQMARNPVSNNQLWRDDGPDP